MKNSVKIVLVFLLAMLLLGVFWFFTGSEEDGVATMVISGVVGLATIILESFARKGR